MDRSDSYDRKERLLSIRIKLNEKEINIAESISILDVKEEYKPDADLIIYQGAVLSELEAEGIRLNPDDSIVFIKKGEIPSKRELESLMVARHSPGVHKKIKRAVVGIAGVGGLGSNVAVALARIGIGKLVIADFDLVEPSNLNRQAFNIDQIGRPKVKALRDNIRRINPYTKVETHQIRLTAENVPKIYEEVNVLVEGFDAPEEKAMLVTSFGRSYPEKSIVMASGLAGYATSNWIKTQRIGKSLFAVGDMKAAAGIGCGLMAPRVGIAAYHQANLVLRLVLGEEKQKPSFRKGNI